MYGVRTFRTGELEERLSLFGAGAAFRGFPKSVKGKTQVEGWMKETAELMKALSDETRLRIVSLLQGRELCVCDLGEALALGQAKISRHLAVLRAAGLVEDERRAQWMYYRLAEGWWMPVLDSLFRERVQTTETGSADEHRLEAWLAQKGNRCPE